MFEEIISKESLMKAAIRVSRNNGVSGVDGIIAKEASEYIDYNFDVIHSSLNNETYEPGLIKKVQIPKPNGKYRTIGIPRVIDRIIQKFSESHWNYI